MFETERDRERLCSKNKKGLKMCYYFVVIDDCYADKMFGLLVRKWILTQCPTSSKDVRIRLKQKESRIKNTKNMVVTALNIFPSTIYSLIFEYF